MDTTVSDSLLGTLVDGRYRIRFRIARGGMATVYAAVDERLERTVAVKIIHASYARDPDFVRRFTDEAKTIARLTHPNVVAVYDQGVHGGVPYLVMEYVRGRTLRDLLGERRRLDPAEALAVLDQMLSAIAAAHRAGLVHRDVKPENVLVAEAPGTGLIDGVVKVADFGLARAVEEASADDEHGQQLLATVAYVAPELVSEGHADPRSDVYSAGIVLFEMLTGRVPYESDKPIDVAWQHVDQDVPPPSRVVPGLPPAVDDLVARCTRREPGARPTDAGAMLAEVTTVREDLGQAATRHPSASDPTVLVPRVEPARPSWARLPDSSRPVPHPRAEPRRRRVVDEPPPPGRIRGWLAMVTGTPRGRIGLAAALVVLALLAAVGGWWFGVGRYTKTPDLGGQAKSRVEQLAKTSGFTLRYDDGRYDEKVAKDVVLAQRPRPGERILSGGTITLTLSRGPERYPMPDVVGREYDLTIADLQQLRLVAEKTEVYDDNAPAGTVVGTEPAAGTVIPPGATIKIKVSKGRAPATVPNVVGKNLTEARQIMSDAGLSLAVKQQDSPKPKDQVLEQDPVDGVGVEKGATVTVTVSNGPPLVPVPDVVNHTLEEATTILTQAGFQVIPQGAGIVRGMFVPPGVPLAPNTPLAPGSQIIIVATP